jgi:DNA-binding MarR family transcriptional regulator
MPQVAPRQTTSNDAVHFVDVKNGGVAFVLSAQQLRIGRVLLGHGEAETADLYETSDPDASERASLSRSIRRLEELNIVERPGRGQVRLTDEGREFLTWALEERGLDDFSFGLPPAEDLSR